MKFLCYNAFCGSKEKVEWVDTRCIFSAAKHHTGYLAVATQLKSESRIKLAGVIVQQTQIFNDNLTLSGWLSDQSRKISSKQLHC